MDLAGTESTTENQLDKNKIMRRYYKEIVKQSTGADIIIAGYPDGLSTCRVSASKFPHFSTRNIFTEPRDYGYLEKILPQGYFAYAKVCAIISPSRLFLQLLSDNFYALEEFTAQLTSTYDYNFPPLDIEYVNEDTKYPTCGVA
ncbi:hypothetical protein CDAR_514921 [Caerostris darwini]|uniref:Uncharacterized protein n=1 Tax=Caerostris darwini TaxID=1538125 RepID=A0AAV4TCK3_9ARAC|nr:hypothetical protein CDAR_514921 [Caerostris darwini]